MIVTTAPPARIPLHRQLYVQVLAAIVLGAIVGHVRPDVAIALKPLGDAFVKLVRMIVAPVIFLTVATGIAGMAELRAVGRVAVKAFAYFLAVSTLALFVGLAIANVVRPGAALHIDPATLSIVPDVPVAGMALILGVDRFMSECRSLTNFIGNAVATIVVARWEGKLDRERLAEVLGRSTTPAKAGAQLGRTS